MLPGGSSPAALVGGVVRQFAGDQLFHQTTSRPVAVPATELYAAWQNRKNGKWPGEQKTPTAQLHGVTVVLVVLLKEEGRGPKKQFGT